MSHVFISYSTRDQHFVERLRNDLKAAHVDYWLDKEGLQPGTPNWERAIKEAIKSAENVIYVATPNAYKSEYVQSELAVAEIVGRKIYPLWVDGEWVDCAPLGMVRAQYIDMRRDAYSNGLPRLLSALGGTVPDLGFTTPKPSPLPVGVEPRNPYKGLKAFDENDAGDFFGRAELIEALRRKLKAMVREESERLLAVIGPSGSGKSSVVKAGLIPNLKRQKESSRWTFLETITPRTRPVRELAKAFYKVFPSKSFDAIEDDLRKPHAQGLRNLAELCGTEPVIFVIDQFEELFMPVVSEDERQQFINLIVAAVNDSESPLTVIVTLRADFYDRPMNYPALGRLIEANSKSVLPMSLVELREAIERPAALPDVRLTFESGLVGELVFDLREDTKALAGALPLLQFTLELLYNRRSGNQLTLDAYEAIGRVNGAIGNHAEEAFATLDEDAQAALPKIFYSLVNVDERGEATRKRAPLTELTRDPSAERLVNALIKERLLLSDRGEDEIAYVEVAHEALLRSWGRLAEWIKTATEDLRLWQRVNKEAEEWDKAGRPKFLLWSFERQKPVDEMLERLDITPSGSLADFLQPEAERLLEEFKAAKEHRQLTIVDTLERMGEAAVPILVDAFPFSIRDLYGGSRVRKAIIDILESYRSLVPLYLARGFQSEVENVRGGMIILYHGLKKPYIDREILIEGIIQTLQHPDYIVREISISLLADFRDPSFIPIFQRHLKDPAPNLRAASIRALMYFQGSLHISIFEDRLRDKWYTVREAAINALAPTKNPRYIPIFKESLKEEWYTVKVAAIQALAEFENPEIAQQLLSYINDANSEVRAAVISALGRMRDETYIPLFQSKLNDEGYDVRVAVLQALAQFSDLSLLPVFVQSLEDLHKYVFNAAAEAIAKLNHPDCITPLVERLTHPFSDIEQAAQKALEMMTIPEAKMALEEWRRSQG